MRHTFFIRRFWNFCQSFELRPRRRQIKIYKMYWNRGRSAWDPWTRVWTRYVAVELAVSCPWLGTIQSVLHKSIIITLDISNHNDLQIAGSKILQKSVKTIIHNTHLLILLNQSEILTKKHSIYFSSWRELNASVRLKLIGFQYTSRIIVATVSTKQHRMSTMAKLIHT